MVARVEINEDRLSRFNELELCLMNQYPRQHRKRWFELVKMFHRLIIKEEEEEYKRKLFLFNATPVLRGKDADRFLRKMLKKETSPISKKDRKLAMDIQKNMDALNFDFG